MGTLGRYVRSVAIQAIADIPARSFCSNVATWSIPDTPNRATRTSLRSWCSISRRVPSRTLGKTATRVRDRPRFRWDGLGASKAAGLDHGSFRLSNDETSPNEPLQLGGRKMTAEIAVLNKSAAALAADSAVTIGRPPNLKVYNTVNKIFELSAHHPVGIMIYGRLDFMGLPYETIVKEYRKRLADTAFPHVSDYKDDFLKYLSTEMPIDDDHRLTNFKVIASDCIAKIGREIDIKVMDDIRTRMKYLKSKVNGISQKLLNAHIKELQSIKFAPGYSTLNYDPSYESAVDDLIAKAIDYVPTDKTKKLLKKHLTYCLAKAKLSSYKSGLVFVGFGNNELCPSLECVETDGIINGKLKVVSTKSIDISRKGPAADVVGFAQDDMAEEFLSGVHPDFLEYVTDITAKIIDDIEESVLSALIQDDVKKKATLAALEPTITKMKEEYSRKRQKYIDDNFRNQIKDMIRSMPKQELALLAATLIEITSLKRKVSKERETVGGEVDVAIISKSEGFVWVKRKHYFPSELNPRFFERHYKR